MAGITRLEENFQTGENKHKMEQNKLTTIVIFDEKHDRAYYAYDTPEGWHKIALEVFTQRDTDSFRGSSYAYIEESLLEPIPIPDAIPDGCPDWVAKEHADKMDSYRRAVREQESNRRLFTDIQLARKGDARAAVAVLQEFNGYEYQSFDIRTVRNYG